MAGAQFAARIASAPVRPAAGRGRAIQRKLVVGPADDRFEREADEAAAWAMAIIHAPPRDHVVRPMVPARASRIARAAPIGAAGGAVDDTMAREIESARSGGRPLESRIRGRMENAFGADFSGVRMHVGPRSDEFNEQMQARAFTTGADIFVRQQDYAPGTSAGGALLAHELAHTLQQGGSSTTRRRSVDTGTIQRYTDIPTATAWKADSKLARTSRSDELKQIDAALAEYDTVRLSTDLQLKREKMRLVEGYIREWEKEKKAAGVAKSERKVFIDELKTIVETKVRENLDAHAVELQPLTAEYRQAAVDRDMDLTLAKGERLEAAHPEVLATTAADGLTTTDKGEWATIFFSAPHTAVGAHPFTSLTIKAIGDFSWMTRRQADAAIERFILPHGAKDHQNQIMQMLQHAPFRTALLAKATPTVVADLVAKMPIVRIAAAAEADAANKGPTPSVTEIADSVFSAFLGDQPVTDLGYATNSAVFSTANFMLGNTAAAQRAPCMTLSNMLTEVFKAVLPSGNPASIVMPIQDMVPLLTKPLAGIGTGTGILTREASFHGNVERFGDVMGYASVNRIFFGDGHEWLQVGTKEYDPTLGISGPVGTVRSQVEPLTFAQKGSKYKASDGKTATKNKHKPPGGAPLMFDRSYAIK